MTTIPLARERADQPRRVLFVLQSTAIGGMETIAIDLAAEIASRGIVVAVVVPAGPDFDLLAAKCESLGLGVFRQTTDARDGYLRLGWSLARFGPLVRAWKPDVIHLHTGGATGGFGVMAVTRLLSHTTVVSTEHDVPSETPGRCLRLSARLRDRIRHTLIAVSRRNSRLRSERLPTPVDRYAVIPNGIPIAPRAAATGAETRSRLRSSLGIDDDVTVFGCVVRLADGKGLHDLLRAFALIQPAFPSRLVLVGDGPLRAELERLADELGVRERVDFVGFQRDPAPYLQMMDAFVLAVPAGTGSIALLEAMAAGVPPIITFCGPEEAVIPEETGLCAPPNDPAGLAEALGRMVEDVPLRNRLGLMAAAHIRRHFSIARVADDHLDLYRAAAVGRVPRRLRSDAPPNSHPGDTTGDCRCVSASRGA